MALFNNLGKKIAKTSQNIVRETKDLTDIARFNALISEDQKKISELYFQLGKLYYETYNIDGEEIFKNICHSIKNTEERILTHKENIIKIKGLKNCPNCGIEVPSVSAFCGNCGTPIHIALEISKQTCINCNAKIEEHMIYCISCGQKIE